MPNKKQTISESAVMVGFVGFFISISMVIGGFIVNLLNGNGQSIDELTKFKNWMPAGFFVIIILSGFLLGRFKQFNNKENGDKDED